MKIEKSISNFSKELTQYNRNSKDIPYTSTPKSSTKALNTKCFKCLGFGHIVVNCLSRRTMMVKRG